MMEIEQILEGFRPTGGIYKRECVDAAVAQQAEVTPHLINILRGAADDPDGFLMSDRSDHVYAVMLLRHFHEPSAHEAILDVFSLPEEYTFELFGDIVTEDLVSILLQTCGSETEGIRALSANKDANLYCRSAAQESLVHAVIEGYVPREEIVEFFRELLMQDLADEDVDSLNLLLPSVCDLYPEELMSLVKQVYDKELMPSWMPSLLYEDFEEALEDGKDIVLKRTKSDMLSRRHDNIHAAMDWWASWDEPLPVSAQVSQSASAAKKNQKKNKRKMAKKSKRKNRRKKK